jgi:hypothetical protein
MIGDNGEKDDLDLNDVDDDLDDELDDDLDDEESSDDMPDIGGDTIIDVTGELEILVDKFEKTDADEVARRREIRRRLDEIAERRNMDLDSTFNFDLNED